MIFIGDIAHPFVRPPYWTKSHWPWGIYRPIIANLEGAIVKETRIHLENRKLFNHTSIVDALVSNNVKVVNLANNHIMDIPGALEETREILKARGIQVTGGGKNIHNAGAPAKIVHNEKTYLFLGFGWTTIQCRSATDHSAGVNPLEPIAFLRAVKHWRAACPDAVLVLLLHWNYEMELYPQPAHRQLAMTAIDAGADAVFGHHTHCVGGIEIYNGRLIAYSLGNWWIPQGVYWDGKLRFCDETLRQLALEWSLDQESVCHWFDYCRENHELIHAKSERLPDSDLVKQLTPFAGMSQKEYQKWFSSYRIKRKALPIYRDYRHSILNSLKDKYVHMRQSVITALEITGLRRLLK